ncbi:SH3 domain-containing protein [Gemmobacter serpentinus]|uniref:SH3 domain-containing protein n=1 Tax=Gemmobacter serpentinus TaxID=2652247 RepID=UPI00124CFD7A|nr:SH3 domain-containing protein [Gemmobacter serpentinus]
MGIDIGRTLRNFLIATAIAGSAVAQTEPEGRVDAEDVVAAIEAATRDQAAAASDAVPAADATSAQAAPADAAAEAAQRDPSRGQVTNLPLPRFVTLKTDEGNARRGPGLSHRIDWVFTRAGMPLRVTAEYENWRRVEDQEGLGGWVHYSLLSGVRSVIISAELADFRASADTDAEVVLRAERGVIARVLQCNEDWCRLTVEGERGWVSKAALWGVEPGEIIE